MPFIEDLARGEYWEYVAAQAVGRKLGYLIRISDGKKYDVQILVPKTTEVKTDFRSEETGNIYIETFNPRQGGQSGINISSADLWIYCLPHVNALFLFERIAMLAYINENASTLRQVRGGDNNSAGCLIPITTLEKLDFVTKIPIAEHAEMPSNSDARNIRS